MHVIETPAAMQEQARCWQREGRRIGLVPTMGSLHEGHLSLIDAVRPHCDMVVLSIFVNPTQFAPTEDLEAYPRDLQRDLRLCRRRGVTAVFAPAPEAMYAADESTWVVEERLSQPLCGRSRPGHFRGVTTVVTKLFHIVLPDVAAFGQKDAQQALVLQRMTRDLCFPVHLLICPIVREPDGLAMSSRNAYLTPDERERATAIFRGLRAAHSAFGAGERDALALRRTVQQAIEAAGGRVEYAEVVSRGDLRGVTTVTGPAMIAVAARFGTTRLIDNMFLEPSA